MRGYASIVGTEVQDWVAQRVQADAVSNETEEVGGVWVQTTHDARSDVLHEHGATDPLTSADVHTTFGPSRPIAPG